MNLAVLCPSEIAYRRFMPALQEVPFFDFYGVGVATAEERCAGTSGAKPENQENAMRDQMEFAKLFKKHYGGSLYDSYQNLLIDPDVEAVYIPLPPGLHYHWAKQALEHGKHVLLEKPFTVNASQTYELIAEASRRNLAVHENYMFTFHNQISYVRDALASGKVGDVRLIRIDFGFPFRGVNDFRYSKELGGGALLDCGGYTLKLASLLLGPSAKVATSRLCAGRNIEVDLYGNATLENDNGLVAQVSFGMDNDYRCDIDVWGSEATLRSGRILTAPNGFEPTMVYSRNGQEERVFLDSDDSFKKSIEHFALCIENDVVRKTNSECIQVQADLVQAIADKAE